MKTKRYFNLSELSLVLESVHLRALSVVPEVFQFAGLDLLSPADLAKEGEYEEACAGGGQQRRHCGLATLTSM